MNRQVYGSGIDQVMGADLARSQLNSQELAQAMALIQQTGRQLQQERQFKDEQSRLKAAQQQNYDLGLRRVLAMEEANKAQKEADREARMRAAKLASTTRQAQSVFSGLTRNQVDPKAAWDIGSRWMSDPDTAELGFAIQQAARGKGEEMNAAADEAAALAKSATAKLKPVVDELKTAEKAIETSKGQSWWDKALDYVPGGDKPLSALEAQKNAIPGRITSKVDEILKSLGDEAGALVFDPENNEFKASPVFKRYDMSLFDNQPMPTSGAAIGGASDPEAMQSGAADQMTFPSTRKPAAPPADQQARDTTAAGGGAPKPPSAPTRARLPDGTIVTIDPAEFQNIVAELVRKGHTAEDAQRIAVSRLLRLAQQGAYNSVLPPSNEPSRTQPPRGYSSSWRPVGSGIPLGF